MYTWRQACPWGPASWSRRAVSVVKHRMEGDGTRWSLAGAGPFWRCARSRRAMTIDLRDYWRFPCPSGTGSPRRWQAEIWAYAPIEACRLTQLKSVTLEFDHRALRSPGWWTPVGSGGLKHGSGRSCLARLKLYQRDSYRVDGCSSAPTIAALERRRRRPAAVEHGAVPGGARDHGLAEPCRGHDEGTCVAAGHDDTDVAGQCDGRAYALATLPLVYKRAWQAGPQ